MFWARVLAWAALGWLLANLGYSIVTFEFWCVVAIVWAIERSTELIVVEQIRSTYQQLLAEEEKKEESK